MALGFRHLTVLLDSQDRLSRPGYHVITSEDCLQEVYGGVTFRPAVSLTRDLLVCAHRGLCPTGGYAVAIEAIRLLGRDLMVKVRTRDPAPDEFVTLVATYPADVVAIPRHRLGRPGTFRAIFTVSGTDVAVVPFVI